MAAETTEKPSLGKAISKCRDVLGTGESLAAGVLQLEEVVDSLRSF